MIQTSLFSISVFLAGVLSFFSPCILPLMPVYVGILLDSERVKKRFGFLEEIFLGMVWSRPSVLLQVYQPYSSS